MRNKPNSGDAGWDEAGRTPVAQPPSAVEFTGPPPRAGVLHVCSSRRRVRQTNPIPGGAGGPDPAGQEPEDRSLSIRPCGLRPSLGWLYKQTQFAPGGRRRPSPRPEALTLPPVGRISASNKANFLATPPGTGLDCAKRTQFAPDRLPEPPQGPIMQNEPNFGQRIGRAGGRSCQTKPNLGRMGHPEQPHQPGRLRQTNPIPGDAGVGRGHRTVGHKANAPNEPNCRRHRVGGVIESPFALASIGKPCKTKPIPRMAQTRIRAWEKKSYEGLARRDGCEKQSQFRPREPPAAMVGRGRKDPCSTAALGCGIQRTTPEGRGATRLFVTRASAPNKPNLARQQIWARAGKTVGPGDRRCAKRTQFPAVLVGRRPQERGTWANAQNEPNSSISDCGLRIGDRSAAGRPCGLPPRPRQAGCINKPDWPEPIVRNEANFSGRPSSGDEMCETNPISSGARYPHHSNIPLFHRSRIPILAVHPSQQWGCWRIDGGNLGSILSGDSVR